MRAQKTILVGVALLLAVPSTAQQIPDEAFRPAIESPAYEPGRGPTIVVDAAHLNFHTADGGYSPFAELLRRDGYRVESSRDAFTREALTRADVMVIANAMHVQSEAGWAPLPSYSAFTESEIAALEAWVRAGGALWLIADHMPLAGHAEALAAAFGIRFQNGFAFDASRSGQLTFRRSDGSLPSSIVTNGVAADERVDYVTTFTGQAFRLDPGVRGEPVMVLPEGHQLLLPEVAFEFSDRTPRISAANLLQGALVYHGEGRVAAFGEAAMFTAQLGGPEQRPFGMNSPDARENSRFALNVARWLARGFE